VKLSTERFETFLSYLGRVTHRQNQSTKRLVRRRIGNVYCPAMDLTNPLTMLCMLHVDPGVAHPHTAPTSRWAKRFHHNAERLKRSHVSSRDIDSNPVAPAHRGRYKGCSPEGSRAGAGAHR
jgi:hypothetical protein